QDVRQVFFQAVDGIRDFHVTGVQTCALPILDLMKHIWLPVVILAVGGTGGMIRTVRANLLDQLQMPYVDTARAKGLPEWKVVLRSEERRGGKECRPRAATPLEIPTTGPGLFT